MTKLFQSDLRRIGHDFARSLSKSSASILSERGATSGAHFDVFLTHAKLYPEVLLGVLCLLEAAGLRVYVDWREGFGVMRANAATSAYRSLFRKMSYANALLYAYAHNAPRPKCLPWELAHFEGSKLHVATIPIYRTLNVIGTEAGFLPLYPSMDISKNWLTICGAGFAKLAFSNWTGQPLRRQYTKIAFQTNRAVRGPRSEFNKHFILQNIARFSIRL